MTASFPFEAIAMVVARARIALPVGGWGGCRASAATRVIQLRQASGGGHKGTNVGASEPHTEAPGDAE